MEGTASQFGSDQGWALVLTPTNFVLSDKLLEKLILWSALLPLIFILLKKLDFQLVSLQASDNIIGIVSLFHPVVETHYGDLRKLRTAADAANYAVFSLTIMVLFSIVIARSTERFLRNADAVGNAGGLDVLALVVGIPGGVIFLFFDEPSNPPTSIASLYFDSVGIYYIRQWMIASVLGIGASTAIIWGIRTIMVQRNS